MFLTGGLICASVKFGGNEREFVSALVGMEFRSHDFRR